ncbi:MAG: fibronectin type III domain-containing protein, partial [Spirochaetaceae bacterium]|nr:fibronectin type III domain-containing protein [Spirochaetaceae bacterium]
MKQPQKVFRKQGRFFPQHLIVILLPVFFVFSGCPDVNGGGSVPSVPVITTVPDIPAGLSASDGTHVSFIRLTWNPSYGAEGYKIFWAGSLDGNYTQFDTTSATSFDDYDGGDGSTYYFRIKAYNTLGESGFSGADSGWAIDYTGGSWTPPEG